MNATNKTHSRTPRQNGAQVIQLLAANGVLGGTRLKVPRFHVIVNLHGHESFPASTGPIGLTGFANQRSRSFLDLLFLESAYNRISQRHAFSHSVTASRRQQKEEAFPYQAPRASSSPCSCKRTPLLEVVLPGRQGCLR